MVAENEGYVFGLDIGTRSIVGTVGYRVGTDRFVVVAQKSLEHKTRAVIDGQIHDISTVAASISVIKRQLEDEIRQPLTHVSIAAAGRVLKTETVFVEHEMPSETKVTKDHIHSLDSLAVEKAYERIRKQTEHKDKHFYCVGYSPVKYYLNGYPMEMIEKQLQVMDLTAVSMCKENNIHTVVFNGNQLSNISKVLADETIGTVIK